MTYRVTYGYRDSLGVPLEPDDIEEVRCACGAEAPEPPEGLAPECDDCRRKRRRDYFRWEQERNSKKYRREQERNSKKYRREKEKKL